MDNIKLVLLRHGESLWNKENRFTGWTDVDLSEKGIQEAKEAGQTKERKFCVRYCIYLCAKKGDQNSLDRSRRDGLNVDTGSLVMET